MITKIKNGKLILPKGICEKNIYFEDGKITAITNDNIPFDEEYDANGNYVSPGFIVALIVVSKVGLTKVRVTILSQPFTEVNVCV